MITIQNADKALKDYYLEAISSQLNENISPFFSAIEKSSDSVFGKDVKIAVVRGNAGSVAAGDENADLPEPYKNRYLEIALPLKNIYGTIEISDKALRASKDSSGAFVSLVNAEMEGLIGSAKHHFQRMLFGDGTGKICRVLSKVSDGVYKVDVLKDYFLGLNVDVIPDNPVFNDSYNLHIIAIDKEKSTVTFDKDTILDNILNKNMCLHGAYGNEITGLGALFSSAKLYGYDKSEESFMCPYDVDCDNDFTEDKLIEILDSMEEKENSKINMILCSYATRRRIAKLIADNRRVVNTIDARTGFNTVSVNDVPVYADKYCPEDVIYFINTGDFRLCQLCDWEWLEDEDGKILKQVPGKAAYTATLVKYAELVCTKPCGQARLYNIKAI